MLIYFLSERIYFLSFYAEYIQLLSFKTFPLIRINLKLKVQIKVKEKFKEIIVSYH